MARDWAISSEELRDLFVTSIQESAGRLGVSWMAPRSRTRRDTLRLVPAAPRDTGTGTQPDAEGRADETPELDERHLDTVRIRSRATFARAEPVVVLGPWLTIVAAVLGCLLGVGILLGAERIGAPVATSHWMQQGWHVAVRLAHLLQHAQ